jgi:hypothetical protein
MGSTRHFRKPSDEDKYRHTDDTAPSLWSKLTGGGGAGAKREKESTLPTYGKRSSTVPQRPFYDDRRSSNAGLMGGSSNPIILLRNVVLRPIYLLGRRGPLFPIVGFLILLLFYLTYSTSPRSQSVKLRVQGAVGPYIPQRAAEAIRWRAGSGGAQDVLAGNLLGGGGPAGAVGGSGKRLSSKNKGSTSSGSRNTLDPKDLPPVRIDSRMLLEEGKPHPIPALMKKAKQDWEALKARQSKTFAEAVREYKRRHGRNPPKGFDRWCVLPFSLASRLPRC